MIGQRAPSPGSRSLATLPREGGGQKEELAASNVEVEREQPSPLAGEGGALLRAGRGGGVRSLPELAKEQQTRRREAPPSPLPRGLKPEEFAKLQVKRLRYAMTDTETRLWHQLKAKRFENFKFRRQEAIGRYIVDFVCYGARVIVEVDGGQHGESQHDVERDAWLVEQGFRVVRLWNSAVFENMDGCLVAILDALRAPSPGSQGLATLPREGGGQAKEEQPSPLAGEGGLRSEPGEGSRS